MNKGGKLVTGGFMAALLILTVVMAVVAAEQTPPEAVTIKAGIWPTPTMGAVQYPHKKHAEELKISCDKCHHSIKDGKNVWKQGDPVQKCETCHNEPTVKGESALPPDQQKKNLKIAFHTRCQGCHKETKAKSPDSKAPTACTGCHGAKKS